MDTASYTAGTDMAADRSVVGFGRIRWTGFRLIPVMRCGRHASEFD